MGIVSVVLLVSSFVYYFVFSSRADNLVEGQSREINKQIVLNYESYIESIIETANFLQISSLQLDLRDDFDELQRLYNMNSQIKTDVVALFLFDVDGLKLLGDAISAVEIRKIPDEQWFRRAVSDAAIFHFISSGSRSISIDRNEEVISVAKQVSYFEGAVERTGVLLIELNFQVIRNLAEKTNLGVGGNTLIIDDDDSLIFSSESTPELSEENLKSAVSMVLGGRKTSIGIHDFFLNINTLTHTRWRIATLINVDEIDSIRKNILPVMLLIFISSIVMTAVVAGVLSLRISAPIRQLQRIMQKIEMGAIDTEVKVVGQKEIVSLGQSFDSMIEKIRNLMDRIVNEQKEKRKTELRALQNQINPHFLYNSLDSIVWLAEHQRSDDVITTVIALARFFRISISRGDTFINVGDEIEHVKNYLTIQSIRYVEKFRYIFEIENDILDRKVMKLILQPLVENAIHHGIDEEGGLIVIRGRMESSILIFEVSNSGYGLTDSRIQEIHDHLDGNAEYGAGVGLRNVNQRLKLYYGDEAGIRISSHPDEDTTVTIRIPLLEDSPV